MLIYRIWKLTRGQVDLMGQTGLADIEACGELALEVASEDEAEDTGYDGYVAHKAGRARGLRGRCLIQVMTPAGEIHDTYIHDYGLDAYIRRGDGRIAQVHLDDTGAEGTRGELETQCPAAYKLIDSHMMVPGPDHDVIFWGEHVDDDLVRWLSSPSIS